MRSLILVVNKSKEDSSASNINLKSKSLEHAYTDRPAIRFVKRLPVKEIPRNPNSSLLAFIVKIKSARNSRNNSALLFILIELSKIGSKNTPGIETPEKDK